MATRQTRRQLQFSGFEMGLITVSFLVTVTTVFFLGLFVGKKNASYHAPAEDRVARIPVDDFTRYKRPAPLAPPSREAKEARTAAADAAAATAGKVGPAGDVSKSADAAVTAEPPAGQEAVAVSTKTPPAATAPADAAGKDALAIAKQAAAEKEADAKDAAAKAAAAKVKEKEEAEAETGRGYTVQILATRKEADADALVRKLKSRGYAAYIKKVSDGAGAWYRVRVGSYGAFSQARTMADKCRQDLGLGQAFVSTE